MTRCTRCECDVETFHDETAGYLVCTLCGHIIEQVSWSSDPQFTKEGGEATVAGHFVSNNAGSHGLGRISGGRIYGLQYDSTEKASTRGKNEIISLVEKLGISPKDDVINAAHRIYQLAIHHNFTRGRRVSQIAAAAIYIICRQEGHPFMLLDFSDSLHINVFVLGSVFLQLGKLLRLEDHPIMTRPVDPSLYLHRFADRLQPALGRKVQAVAGTALRLVASMKRDWLQTGRKPAGITGAALFVSCHIHGCEVSKEDVVKAVRIGVSTLDKRVSEFAATGSSSLTVTEFDDISRSLEAAEQRELLQLEQASAAAGPSDAARGGPQCTHIGQGAPYFACGMCKECYLHFLQVSGGMGAGANPPAFRPSLAAAPSPARLEGGEAPPARLEGGEAPLALPQFPGEGADDLATEIEAAVAADSAAAAAEAPPAEAPPAAGKRRRGKAGGSKPKRRRGGAPADSPPPADDAEELAALAALVQEEGLGDGGAEQPLPGPPVNVYETPQLDVKETLSDVSDEEAEGFLHSEEEVRLKAIVWTAMNQDYIDKQALKAACRPPPEEEAEAAAPAEGSAPGKRPRGRPKGSKSRPKPEDQLEPSDSAADGVRKLLTAKKLSSKINYEALDSLFDSPAVGGKPPAHPPPQPRPQPSSPPASAPAAAGKPPLSPQRGRGGGSRPRARPTAAGKSAGGKEPASPAGGGSPTGAARPRLRTSALGSLKSGLPQLSRRKAPG